MNALEKEVQSWVEKAPPTQEIADDYIKAIDVLRERPNQKNMAMVEHITAVLIAKVLYENGYVPVFENEQLVGYAPKDLNEMN